MKVNIDDRLVSLLRETLALESRYNPFGSCNLPEDVLNNSVRTEITRRLCDLKAYLSSESNNKYAEDTSLNFKEELDKISILLIITNCLEPSSIEKAKVSE